MNQEQKAKLFCPSKNHNKCPIKFMCLSDSCINLRLFCLECIKEDKHAGHQSQIKDFKSYSEYYMQNQNELSQFITEIQNQLLQATTELIQFFEGLQQKYIIPSEQFHQLNVFEMNSAISQMMRMKSFLDTLQPQFQDIINNLGEMTKSSLQELDLSQSQYIEKIKQQGIKEQNKKIHCSEIITTQASIMNSQIIQCQPQKIKKINPTQYRKMILIGQAAVGKTKLFNQLRHREIQNTPNGNQIFQSLQIDEYQYTIVDTPSFEMDNDINVREQTIQYFSPYFYENTDTISTLGIVVNYCHLNEMKKKIMEVYKYVRKLQSEILIIVVEWEKCQDSQKDQATIREKFLKIGTILFVRNDLKYDTLRREFNLVIRPIPEQKIQLQGTIFEK